MGFDSSIKSQVKKMDTVSFDSSVEQEVWNSINLGGSVGIKETDSLTFTSSQDYSNSK